MTHVDDAALVKMRDGMLSPDELLEADDHLAGCEACRARFAAIIATESAHLEPEEIARLATGVGSLEAQSHLASCRLCADQVRELMPFADQVDDYAKGRPRVLGRVAAGLAAAIVVASGAWWLSRGARPDGGAAVIASVDAARAVVLHDGGRTLSLDVTGQLQGGQGLSARDSAWTVDALRGIPLRGPLTGAAPGGHLLKGALAERAGDWRHAAEEYRALSEENPGSALAAQLVARVTGHR